VSTADRYLLKEETMVPSEQDWDDLRPLALKRKSPQDMAKLVAKLESAARREQEQVKRRLRPRVEAYRRLQQRRGH
jgi:hypothetical protein